MIRRADKQHLNIPDGLRGLHPNVYGDFSGLSPNSDISNITGDVSRLKGIVSEHLRGDVSGLAGDVSKIFGLVSKNEKVLIKISKDIHRSAIALDIYNNDRHEPTEAIWNVLNGLCRNLLYYSGYLEGMSQEAVLRLYGDPSNIEGCVTRIWGYVSVRLTGSVTGLRGDVTGIEGDATDQLGTARLIVEAQENSQ